MKNLLLLGVLFSAFCSISQTTVDSTYIGKVTEIGTLINAKKGAFLRLVDRKDAYYVELDGDWEEKYLNKLVKVKGTAFLVETKVEGSDLPQYIPSFQVIIEPRIRRKFIYLKERRELEL